MTVPDDYSLPAAVVVMVATFAMPTAIMMMPAVIVVTVMPPIMVVTLDDNFLGAGHCRSS